MLNAGKGFADISELLSTLDEKQKLIAISSSALSQAQKSQLLIQAGVSTSAINASAGFTTMAASQTAAAASTTGLSAAFTGLGISIKNAFMALATNPLTYITAGIVAGGIALNNYIKEFDNAIEKAEGSQSDYSSTVSELESLNSELETAKSRIEELQGLKDAGTITFAEDNELTKLQNQI